MSEIPRPSFVPIWLACKACRYSWDDWQPTNVAIETWAAHVKTYHCPHCGAGGKSILLRAKPLEEASP